jgi:dUTP pyrophosphatase
MPETCCPVANTTAPACNVTTTEAPCMKKTRSMEVLKVKKLSERAQLPKKGSALAAGFDLCSAYDMTVEAGGKAMVPTDLSIAVPSGTYGRVAPRSGLAVKNFIDVGAGVIDEDYRGPVNLFNFGKTDFEIKQGDRIAQLVLEKIAQAEVFECENLDETERGEGGFGSTGVSKAL